MHLNLGVKNFAKIESAKICINGYTLLVGQNNSGKTFLMQLAQGVGERLAYLIDGEIIDILLEEEHDFYCKYIISEENINEINRYFNKKLNIEKKNIIKEIFERDIPIEKLYVDLRLDENTVYEIYVIDVQKYNEERAQSFENHEINKILKLIKNQNKDQKKFINKVFGCLIEKNSVNFKEQLWEAFLFPAGPKDIEEIPLKNLFWRNCLDALLESDSLFLPASRTGLMLLYREFFAKKTDQAMSYVLKGDRMIRSEAEISGLTQPVYSFLRFLQTYSEDSSNIEEYGEEISFFEEKLIEGHISVGKHGNFSYDGKAEENGIPMYLASSMINEIAPIILALTGKDRYQRLIIDEIEASLHPEKQQELVRFLNRLNNKGMHLIISTHSDTFVSKLNNLVILSEYVRDSGNKDALERFDLQEEDLPDPRNLFVYEFLVQPNGKSIVKEIRANRMEGYQFDLFAGSAMRLYDEAVKLEEIQ